MVPQKIKCIKHYGSWYILGSVALPFWNAQRLIACQLSWGSFALESASDNAEPIDHYITPGFCHIRAGLVDKVEQPPPAPHSGSVETLNSMTWLRNYRAGYFRAWLTHRRIASFIARFCGFFGAYRLRFIATLTGSQTLEAFFTVMDSLVQTPSQADLRDRTCRRILNTTWPTVCLTGGTCE